MARNLLTIDVTGDGGIVTIRCSGELDRSVCDELDEAIQWSMTRDLVELRIDMTQLTFIDSSGLPCLVSAADRCRELGARLLITPSPGVRSLVELTATPVPLAKDVATLTGTG